MRPGGLYFWLGDQEKLFAYYGYKIMVIYILVLLLQLMIQESIVKVLVSKYAVRSSTVYNGEKNMVKSTGRSISFKITINLHIYSFFIKIFLSLNLCTFIIKIKVCYQLAITSKWKIMWNASFKIGSFLYILSKKLVLLKAKFGSF